MRFPYRAAALAAAAFGLCTAVGASTPSLAIAATGNAEAATPLTDHAQSALTVQTLGLDTLQDPPAPAISELQSAPAIQHAMTPAFGQPDDAVDLPPPERRSLSQLVQDYSGSDAGSTEADCLARAVYFESKGEPLAGQLTVAQVIINRSRSGRFASSICGVVRQPSQFSFVRGGHIPTPPPASRDWRTAVAISRIALDGLADVQAPRALFFHARRVNPGWHLTRLATIGNHIFYR